MKTYYKELTGEKKNKKEILYILIIKSNSDWFNFP